MRNLRLFLLLVVTLLGACMSQDQKTRLQQQASVPVTCLPGGDCAAKWRRAHDWINENSHFPILKESDTMITVDSSDNTFSTVMSVRMMPNKNDPDENSIVFTAECENMLGCVPTEDQVKAEFVAYVNDTVIAPTVDNDVDLGVTFGAAAKGGGVTIALVTKGSPAANAGLQPGDRLMKFNGKSVTSGAEIAGMVADTPPGSVFPIQFVRGGKTYVNFMQL